MKKMFLLIALIGLMYCVAAYGQVPATGQSSGSFGKMDVGKTTLGTLDVQSIPNKLSYQGLLTTSSGAPAQDGNYNLKFELFDVSGGGSGLWTETQTGVSVQHGTFSVLLGSVTPLTALFDQPLWVEITAMAGPGISSPIVFSPRTELAAVPYALGPWQTNNDNVYILNKNVGIRNSSPLYPLDVNWTGGATVARFGPYDGVCLIANYPQIGFNIYYNGGFKYGTSAYAGATIALDQYVSNALTFNLAPGGVAGDAAPLSTKMVITNNGNVGIGTTSPQAKLDVNGAVQVKDSLFVGSPTQNGIVNIYRNGSTEPIVQTEDYYGYGAQMTLQDELGNPIVYMRPNGWGEGGGIQVYRTTSQVGFEAWGDWWGLGEGYAAVYGNNRSIIFEPRFAGDASVQLPDSSISSAEILDEPGISNSQLISFTTNSTSGTVVVTDSVDITVPAPGYIEIIGGAWLNIYHTTGTTTEVWLGINTIGGSQSVYPGLGVVRLPSDLPTSATSYGYPCTARRFYTVSAGTYRYFLNLRFSGAGSYVQAGYPYVRAVYYPTLYGTSTVISPSAIGLASVSTDGSQQINIEQVTITPEEHLAQLKAKAMLLKSEMEAMLKQLEKKTGDGQANGGN